MWIKSKKMGSEVQPCPTCEALLSWLIHCPPFIETVNTLSSSLKGFWYFRDKYTLVFIVSPDPGGNFYDSRAMQ